MTDIAESKPSLDKISRVHASERFDRVAHLEFASSVHEHRRHIDGSLPAQAMRCE